MTAEHDCDVIIAGGGATGLTLALALTRNTGLRIAVIEASNASHAHPGFDARSVALSQGSCRTLASLGIQVSDFGAAIEHIHVSDRGHLGQCHLHASDYHLPALGYVVELATLGEALHAALPKERIDWLCPDTIAEVSRTPQSVTVSTRSGRSLCAPLLVVAEGGRSATREKLGIAAQAQAYQQQAVIANVSLTDPHQHWAFERFTEQGPLAMLPLPPLADAKHRCSLVWTVDDAHRDQLMALDSAGFVTALQDAFGYRLGVISDVGKRESYPLALIRSEQSISHRAIVLGNAAQSLHPIAGQGLNLALRDIDTCQRLLTEASAQHGDLGDYALLHRYKQARQPDQHTVVTMTDGLVRIFSNDFLPLVVGRNIGLTMMQACPSLKSPLASQAMGLSAQGVLE